LHLPRITPRFQFIAGAVSLHHREDAVKTAIPAL
jgi:hypothetical protein